MSEDLLFTRKLRNFRFLKGNDFLLVRYKNNLHINDRIAPYLNRYENVLLSPNPKSEFYISDEESPDGSSISINTKTLDITLSSGIGNIFPTFYYFENELLIISRKIKSTISVLKHFKRKITFDNKGIISSLIFDFPIEDCTYYEKIKKAEMGTKLFFPSNGEKINKLITWRPVFDKQEYKGLSYRLLIQKAKDIAYSLEDKIPQELCVIPLSGGYDSRFLACLLRHKFKGEVISYTFQRGPSFETYCAKKIAKRLNFNHIIAELDIECYDSFADKIIKDSSGLLTPMHVHGIYASKKYLTMEQKKYNRIFGYYCDAATGQVAEDHTSPNIIKSPKALIDYYLRNSILRNNSELVYELLLDKIQIIFDEFKQYNSEISYFHEYFIVIQRHNNKLTHIFDYHRKDCNVYEPSVDKVFCEFFFGIPQKYRKKEKLFFETCLQLWPDIFSLPTTHLEQSIMLKNFKRVCNLIQYILDKIYGNQKIFKSPFIYEQHSSLLRNDLCDKLNRAYLTLVQEILPNFELPQYYSMPIRGGNTAEAFRILTLYILYKGVNWN